jgi:hypothetical protein
MFKVLLLTLFIIVSSLLLLTIVAKGLLIGNVLLLTNI